MDSMNEENWLHSQNHVFYQAQLSLSAAIGKITFYLHFPYMLLISSTHTIRLTDSGPSPNSASAVSETWFTGSSEDTDP